MRAFNIRPGIGERGLARFDLELTDQVLIKNLALRRTRRGGIATFSPQAQGEKVIHFAPLLNKEIADAAAAEMWGAGR